MPVTTGPRTAHPWGHSSAPREGISQVSKSKVVLDGIVILARFVHSQRKRCEKNGKTGELGQDRLKVRWEAVMFLFNVVNLNV